MKAGPTDEYLRQLALADAPRPEVARQFALDDEHKDAYIIASLVNSGRAHRILEILATHDLPKLRLVVDALEGKRTKSQLTPTGVKIIQAHCVAEWECGRRSYDGTYINLDFSRPAPTLAEVKMQYAISEGETPPNDRARMPSWLEDLEGQKEIPADWTFRKTLKRCELEFREDRRGRPQQK
jgi:hypothetical protein